MTLRSVSIPPRPHLRLVPPGGSRYQVGIPERPPALLGDKVRVKGGTHHGQRGVVTSVRGDRLTALLTNGIRLRTSPAGVTNFSAAARLAWRTMPKRAGRPLGLERKTRVSLRIDSVTWEALGKLADAGRIRSREHLTNELLRDARKRLS